MLDYPTLRLIWWALIGVLLIGFAVMDGHDLGVGALLTLIGRSDAQRRVLLNAVGPHWDGNQVWFVTGGAALFAAWPAVYAVAFSGFYWAMLALLFTLQLRPVGFDFRSKLAAPGWRRGWDLALTVNGTVPPLLFGIAFGNLLEGVPFGFDPALRPYYQGGLATMLSPFALLAGGLALAMTVFHGATYLQLRTEAPLQQRARRAAMAAGLVAPLLFAAAGWGVAELPGYVLQGAAAADAPSYPLAKQVIRQPGAWLGNFARWPALWLIPATGLLAPLAGALLAWAGRPLAAFAASGLTVAAVVTTAGVAMFPFLLPSRLQPAASLTVWDASASRLTLAWMFWAAVLLLPVIVLYTGWCYRKMRGPVTERQIREQDKSRY